jgi:hypothetical protein
MKSKYTVTLFLALIFSAWPRDAVHSQERARIGISAASLGFLAYRTGGQERFLQQP